MTVVVIEGIDGVGKTTLIKQLKEKYPDKIETLAFPSENAKEELCLVHDLFSKQFNTTRELVIKAIIYELDFFNNIEYINSFIYYGGKNTEKTLILDRWFMSNIAYSKFIFPSPLVFPRLYQNFDKIIGSIDRTKMRPSYTILLKTMSPILKDDSSIQDIDSLYKIQKHYEKYLSSSNRHGYFTNGKEFSEVEALTPNTFAIVENILKEKGFLN